jgi:hypothetical protein
VGGTASKRGVEERGSKGKSGVQESRTERGERHGEERGGEGRGGGRAGGRPGERAQAFCWTRARRSDSSFSRCRFSSMRRCSSFTSSALATSLACCDLPTPHCQLISLSGGVPSFGLYDDIELPHSISERHDARYLSVVGHKNQLFQVLFFGFEGALDGS